MQTHIAAAPIGDCAATAPAGHTLHHRAPHRHRRYRTVTGHLNGP